MQGTILRGIGGFYYALDDEGNIHTLRAQGKIRREKLKPKVGDRVEAGESLGAIHARTAEDARTAAELLRGCYELSDEKTGRAPFIKGVVR